MNSPFEGIANLQDRAITNETATLLKIYVLALLILIWVAI